MNAISMTAICGALLLLTLGGCGLPEPTPEQQRLRRQMDTEQTMSQASHDSYQRAVAREQKRKQDWLAGKR